MAVEAVHLCLGIALGEYGNVDSVGRLPAAMDVAMVGKRSPTLLDHKNVRRVETVAHLSHRIVAVVKKVDVDDGRGLGIGHKDSVLEGLRCLRSLVGRQPFMI